MALSTPQSTAGNEIQVSNMNSPVGVAFTKTIPECTISETCSTAAITSVVETVNTNDNVNQCQTQRQAQDLKSGNQNYSQVQIQIDNEIQGETTTVAKSNLIENANDNDDLSSLSSLSDSESESELSDNERIDQEQNHCHSQTYRDMRNYAERTLRFAMKELQDRTQPNSKQRMESLHFRAITVPRQSESRVSQEVHENQNQQNSQPLITIILTGQQSHPIYGEGISSLHLRCATGDSRLIKEFLDYQESQQQPNSNQIHWQQQQYVNFTDVNTPCKSLQNMTPLHMCIEHMSVSPTYSDSECIRVLLDYGADPFLSKSNGVSPFFLSCQRGYTKIVQMFLEHPKFSQILTQDLTDPQILTKTFEHNDNGIQSPLMIAAIHGHYKIVKLLLKASQCKCGTSDVLQVYQDLSLLRELRFSLNENSYNMKRTSIKAEKIIRDWIQDQEGSHSQDSQEDQCRKDSKGDNKETDEDSKQRDNSEPEEGPGQGNTNLPNKNLLIYASKSNDPSESSDGTHTYDPIQTKKCKCCVM